MMPLLLSLMLSFAHAWDCKSFKMPTDAELKKKLTPQQFNITREAGTEPSFHNDYYDMHDEGIFVDRVSGEPLFSSADKYDSHTGWPSFTKPLKESAVIKKTDPDGSRTEIESACSKSHLGHVFDDGPAPTGQRYCMNSASLRFVPKNKLKAEGYGDLLKLFPTKKGK